MSNFDEPINRKNTQSLKYDALFERFGATNLLPMWVADMDFRVSQPITDAIMDIAKHGIYGYSIESQKYYDAIKYWFENKHQWKLDDDDIFFTNGVVSAIHNLINAFTSKGDGVLIQSPVYYPFFSLVKSNDRKLLVNQLIELNNQYFIDFDDFEKKAREASMFILCSPHNPVSRVWKRDELERMAQICYDNNVIIISDEIHSDLVQKPFKHIPTATINSLIEGITITCHSASKTFNLAGLNTAYLITKNRKWKQQMQQHYAKQHAHAFNIFGAEAMYAAYMHSDEWYGQMMQYIKENYEFLAQYIQANIPQVKISPMEATYLVWLDFRAFKMTDQQLKKFIIENAALALNDGSSFGIGGSGFQRINIACPRKTLELALTQLAKACNSL